MHIARFLFVGSVGLAACGGSVQEGSLTQPTDGGSDAVAKGGSGGAVVDGAAGATGGSGGATGGSGGATGGSGGATGGSGGATGGSGGSGGSSPSAVYCKTDADCQVLSDCCVCEALPVGVPHPGCSITECKASVCELTAVPTTNAHCLAGHCTLDVDCDSAKVMCNGLPPPCPVGQVPAVVNQCWTGHCVDPTACISVTACSDCGPASICVTNAAWTQSHHCVPKDPSCTSVTCACYGSNVCTGAYDNCGDGQPGSTELSCSCPTC